MDPVKMDKERIADLQAKLEALRRTNFAEPFEGWIGLATELLDAIEAALAQAEAEGVVVPVSLLNRASLALEKILSRDPDPFWKETATKSVREIDALRTQAQTEGGAP